MPDELLLVPMDGKLMVQVLVNLLDNAFQHTKPDSQVLLRVFRQKDEAVFEVSDNGGESIPPCFPTSSKASSPRERRSRIPPGA